MFPKQTQDPRSMKLIDILQEKPEGLTDTLQLENRSESSKSLKTDSTPSLETLHISGWCPSQITCSLPLNSPNPLFMGGARVLKGEDGKKGQPLPSPPPPNYRQPVYILWCFYYHKCFGNFNFYIIK